MVHYLLKFVDYDISNTRDRRNKSVLHRACGKKKPNPDIVKSLLEFGVDVNYADYCGETALHLACQRRNKEIVQMLIDYGSNVNYVDERTECSSSPIYYAIYSETEIFETLLKYGADIFLITASNICLYDAARNVPEIAKMILKHAVNMSSEKKIGWNDLSCAIFDNDINLAKQLIQNGFQVDMLCAYAAVSSDNIEILKLVWKHVSPELVSKDLYFMIHVFDSWYHEETFEKLWLLLAKDGVDLHLERCGNAFALFIDRRARYVFQDVSGEEQHAMMTALSKRGLRLSETDTERTICCTYHPQFNILLTNIVTVFMPKISKIAFVRSCENSVDKIVHPYCLEINPKVLFHIHQFEWCIERFHYYLSRFSFVNNKNINNFLRLNCINDIRTVYQIRQIVQQIQFKTLVELSRDSFRRYLRRKCRDSRDMIFIFDRMNLPPRIRNIIQGKVILTELDIE